MKLLLLLVVVGSSVIASAQGLLNRGLLRRGRQPAPPLVELMPFTNAVASAKAGDGAGMYAVAIYLARGIDIDCNGELAYKYLCKSADAGYANAQFIRHLIEENASSNQTRCQRVSEYLGGWGEFLCTNKICQGNIDVSDKDTAERLLGLYRGDVANGVDAATNEVARIEAEIKQVQEAQEHVRIAQENRKRNRDLLATELGEKQVDKQTAQHSAGLLRPSVLGGSLRARRMARMQAVQNATEGKLLEKLMPFGEAASKAKNGDGSGCYAVAIHYALGKEIEPDNVKATKYLAKAVEVKHPAAMFVDAMASEERLGTRVDDPTRRMGRLERSGMIEGDTHPNIGEYTGGAQAWQFKSGSQSTASFTNAADVAAVKVRYELAIKLGVNAATNELARFEKRVSVVQAAMQRKKNEINAHRAMLARNARLAKDLLGEDAESDRQKQEATERAAELEQQRRQLMAIQEELRKAREARSQAGN